MKKLRILWPWAKVNNGQAFFVPCLDPEPLKVEGLDQALSVRILNAEASTGVYNGLIGVLFYRRPAPKSWSHRLSSEPEQRSSFRDLAPELFDDLPPEAEYP